MSRGNREGGDDSNYPSSRFDKSLREATSDLDAEIEKARETELPEPTAKFAKIGDDFREEEMRGVLCNPIYTGLGPFPRLVADELWVRSAEKLIEEEGTRQFLVNLLHVVGETIDWVSAFASKSGGGDGE